RRNRGSDVAESRRTQALRRAGAAARFAGYLRRGYRAGEDPDAIEATAPVEPGSGLRKQFTVTLTARGEIRVVHRIRNRNPWTVELGAWALTVMAPGGIGINGIAAARHAFRRCSLRSIRW